MQIKVKNSIFNGTQLEGLPFEYRWYDEKPTNLYEPTHNHHIIKNHRSWYDIQHWNTKEWLQKMFLHDICHCILYASRQDSYRIFEKDFGLDWNSTENICGNMIFHNLSHLLDEYKIVILSAILSNNMLVNKMDKGSLIAKVVDELNYTMDTEDANGTSKEFRIDKRIRRVTDAYEYWISPSGESRIETAIWHLKELINKKARI